MLIGFNPDNVTNLIDFNDYLSSSPGRCSSSASPSTSRVFVVLLNLAGVVEGRVAEAYRPWIIIGTFIFAAVATPSTDPFTMTLMAVPMMVLFFISEVIARFNDRRRARKAAQRRAGSRRAVAPSDPALRGWTHAAVITDVDPFDLPEWLGTHDVVWRADQGLRTGHLVRVADRPTATTRRDRL